MSMPARTRSREREPRPEDLQHASYWDRRYEIDQEDGAAQNVPSPDDDTAKSSQLPDYDWFRSFEDVKSFLTHHLPPPDATGPRILHLGCGNSTLPADMHALGYHDQVAVDFSRVCIDAMRKKYANLSPSVNWHVADVREMSVQVPSADIDVAIDKGTLDAMLHGSLWSPPDSVRESVAQYTDEVARVLKSGALWLYITYRQPHFMRPLLEKKGVWTTSCETLSGEAGAFEYFGWVMTKCT